MKVVSLCNSSVPWAMALGGGVGGGGYLGNSWWGCFQTWRASKIHTYSQTWPLRNYVIIT